jgi:hypothetical protein
LDHRSKDALASGQGIHIGVVQIVVTVWHVDNTEGTGGLQERKRAPDKCVLRDGIGQHISYVLPYSKAQHFFQRQSVELPLDELPLELNVPCLL